jgi:hypothetical protein
MQKEVEGVAKPMIMDFIARPLVFFIPGSGNDIPHWVASGTAFATPAGRVVVLTAEHNVTRARDQPLRMGFHRGRTVLENVVAGIVPHPNLDVAAVALNAEATKTVAPYSLRPGMIGADEEHNPKDGYLLAGFPAAWMLQRWTERPGNKPLWELAFPSTTYGTLLGEPPIDDRGRLRVKWDEREVAGQPPEKMPDPEGISGGALWRFRPMAKGAVWSPEAAGRFIGVPTDFHSADRIELVEPATAWRAWFEDTLNVFDRELPLV